MCLLAERSNRMSTFLQQLWSLSHRRLQAHHVGLARSLRLTGSAHMDEISIAVMAIAATTEGEEVFCELGKEVWLTMILGTGWQKEHWAIMLDISLHYR